MTIFEEAAAFQDRVSQENWHHEMIQEFAKFLGVGKDVRILDVGCGIGSLVRFLAPKVREAVGVDASAPMIRRAREHARKERLSNLTFQEADYLNLPFPDASFDIVASSGKVPALVPDPAKALAEMARVTKPGGVVAAIVPSVRCSTPMALRYAQEHGFSPESSDIFVLVAGVDQTHTHRHFTPEFLTALCADCGLKGNELASFLDGIVLFSKGKRS